MTFSYPTRLPLLGCLSPRIQSALGNYYYSKILKLIFTLPPPSPDHACLIFA